MILNIIKKNTDFQRIFKEGHSISGRYLVVYFLLNSFTTDRFGFAVGAKLGNAVVRNRIKRLVREAVRKVDQLSGQGHDIIIIARNSIKNKALDSIIIDFQQILNKINLYKFNE